MQQPAPPPLLTPRPRPPGRPPTQRTTSSRLTALPQPSTPRSAARRARERERRSLDALGFASEDDEMTGSRLSLAGRKSLAVTGRSRESTGTGASAGSRGSAEDVVARDRVEAPTKASRAPSPVPFPSTDPSPASADPFVVVKPSSSPPTPAPNRQTSPLESVLAPAALGPDHLKSLSREELEKMLAEADRIIREKEQELSVFTHAGEELLQEYHSLRQRHESLVARKPSASGSTTPFQPSSLSTSVHTLPGASKPPATSPARLRPSRESLGRPSPGTSRHLRRASGTSSLHLHEKGSFASDPESPSHASRRSSRISVLTPDDSPTNTRRRHFSSSVTPKSPAARLGISASVLSPAAAARDVASLSQANYALSLQLSDLQADSEVAEREGRKRLRKLERELQALREDLERVEQRNVVLETQAEVAISGNNELMRSIRRYDDMQSKIAGEAGGDEPVRRNIVSDDEDDFRASQSAPVDDLFTSHALSAAPFSPGVVDKSHLSPFRQPGHGSLFPLAFPRSISRTASASSLVPLPAPIELDPSLEQQQDELVDQLMAKIDELQDANEAILAEREEMVCRLDEVQEEVLEWKERCEELEEEIVQNRLVEWKGPIGAIEWRAEEDADAESEADEPSSIRKARARPPTVKRSSTSSSVSTRLSGPTCTSSPVTTFAKLPPPKRTLSNELGEEWSTGANERSDPFDDPSFSSVIDHGLRSDIRRSKLELATSAPSDMDDDGDCPRPPFATTTADDLLHSGGLQYAGYPDAETYDALEKAAASLVPAWEDERAISLSKSRRRKALPAHSIAQGKLAQSTKYDRGAAGRSTAVVVHPDRLLSDDDGFEDEDESPRSSRRWHALRRLQREASSRRGKMTSRSRPTIDFSEDSADFESDISSDYDHLNHSLRRSSDYYPLSVRARYHPRMVVTRVTDTVVQKIVSFVTWIRFFILLGMAIVFAVWQGPQKTLGVIDRRRRRIR